jgi:hypothetical protein
MATETPIEGCSQNEVSSYSGSVGNQNIGDLNTLSRLNRTPGVRKTLGQNAGNGFHGSLGTVGPPDVTRDAAINEHEESASPPGAIPKGGQGCLLSN